MSHSSSPRFTAAAVWVRGLTVAAVSTLLLTSAGGALAQSAETPPTSTPTTTAAVLAAAQPSDWRALDPAQTLYVELASGRVVIELASAFAPQHVLNIQQLVEQRYFDGLVIVRSQDNYVVQWADPNGEDKEKARSLGAAKPRLPAEFDRPLAGLQFLPLGDPDVYAPEVGFSAGFPAARDAVHGRAWLAHCYAMVGAGRADSADSGNGSELYVVIGHSPRHLDRNVTLVGRVVRGMELLSTLPRGTGPLGFYQDPAQHVPLRSIRLAASLPENERTPLEVLRTDTPTFTALIAARRNRRESWFLDPVGHVELCNVPIPVREAAKPAP